MSILSLSDIAGLSRCNVRQDAPVDDDLAELADSIAARGLIEPLLLRREDGEIRVLGGGRRFAALNILWERGLWLDGAPIKHEIFEGTDAEAWEASLLSFLHRKDLNPAEEALRFRELVEKFGKTAEEIARDTGKRVAFVRDRLKLAALPEPIVAAWRAKTISAEQARALCIGADAETQCALLAEIVDCGEPEEFSPDYIRERLCEYAMPASHRFARFVGKEAYLSAGGDLDEQLIPDSDWFLDGALVKRLAAERLSEAVAAIAKKEGWGEAITEFSPDYARGFTDAKDYDFTDAEGERVKELEPLIDSNVAALVNYEEIHLKALLRKIGKPARKGLAILAGVDRSGGIELDRAMRRKAESATAPAQPKNDDDEEPPKPAAKKQESAPKEDQSRKQREVLDAAVHEALSAQVARADCALPIVIVTAALGCGKGLSGTYLGVHAGQRPGFKREHPLLLRIEKLFFFEALAVLIEEGIGGNGDDEIWRAFAEIIAGSIYVSSTDFGVAPHLLNAARALHPVHPPFIDDRLHEALDLTAYFKACTKETIVEAVREQSAIEGWGDQKAAHCAKLKGDKPALYAAELLKRKWLPKPLRPLAPAAPSTPELERVGDTRSLAQAMSDAIDADEAQTAEAKSEAPKKRGHGKKAAAR